MAFMRHGILDGFSGKVGTVVGARVYGVQHMRARPIFNKRRNSTAVDIVKTKFELATRFIQSMKSIVAQTFEANPGMSSYSSATSDALQNAITGTYPDLQLDYSNVLVARGPIRILSASPIAVQEGTGIRFTWNPDDGFPLPDESLHKVVLIFYHPKTDSSMMKISDANRKDGTVFVDLPHLRQTGLITWLAFYSEQSKEYSKSSYSGSIQLS